MPSRKSVRPGTAQSDRRWEPKPQGSFKDVFEDCPPTQVPDNALAKAINGWPQGTSFRPRNGTKLYGSPYPAIEGRIGYAGHKNGNLLISDSGNIFTAADVSNLWMWDNGLSDEITGYVNASTVTVRDDDYNIGTACYIQGKVNLNKWHEKQEKWVIQLGNEFYTANREKTVYTKVLVFGYDLPANSISEFAEDGDNALVANSRYVYCVMLAKNPIRAYPINSPIPTQHITGNETEGEKRHKYHFLYSCGLLDGEGNFINRETKINGNYAVKILTETGTNLIDDNRKDWSVINTNSQIGPRSDTYGKLIGAPLVAPWNAPAGWTGLPDITIQLNINALGFKEIVFDGSTLNTMTELAERAQLAIRLQFPGATCEYVTDVAIGPHFEITSGLVKGGSVEFAIEGINGTPSAATLGLTAAAGAIIETPYLGVPRIIRGLYLPRIQYTTTVDYQWHHNFYHIYRTPDIGPYGLSDYDRTNSLYYSHLNERGKRVVNSPDEFVWEKDLRVAASFIARRINGFIELRSDDLGGEFELADEGSVVEFEDGSRTEIAENGYINSKLARYSDLDYYFEETPWMAACIGNGKAVRVRQVGTILTRVAGSDTTSYTAFTAADERRPVWFPNGLVDYIKRFIDADNVELYQDRDIPETGLTYAPKYRNYNSAIYDEKLFEHSSAWFCRNRFMREVEPSNSITMQPGFIILATRGNKYLRYCPLESSYKPYMGYHVREHQTIELEDMVERLVGFANRYATFCKGSIYIGATNNSVEFTIPETFQKIFILSGVERVSKVGLISYGSLDWIDDDWVRFITNTGEMRDFNGLEFKTSYYGDTLDYAEDRQRGLGRFGKALKRAYKEFNAIYARGVGFISWWKEIGE